jgi:hypothetical protein
MPERRHLSVSVAVLRLLKSDAMKETSYTKKTMQYRCWVIVASMIPWLSSCGSGTNAPAPAVELRPPTPKLEAPMVRVDKFKGHVDQAPGGLKIHLETDLPDDKMVHVTVAREFAVVEDKDFSSEKEARDVGIFYLEREMTVSDARSSQWVSLDKKIVEEAIQKSLTLGEGFHARLASVSQEVDVTFLFGCTKGFEGNAIKPCDLALPAAPIEASSETKVPVPYP